MTLKIRVLLYYWHYLCRQVRGGLTTGIHGGVTGYVRPEMIGPLKFKKVVVLRPYTSFRGPLVM